MSPDHHPLTAGSRMHSQETEEASRARIGTRSATSPADMPDPFAPAARPGLSGLSDQPGAAVPPAGPSPAAASSPPATSAALRPIRAHRTWQQLVGGVLIVAVCVAAAVWYVPRVMRTDSRLLSGTVVNSGVVTLNFTGSGQIDAMRVHLGERVRKGEVLATEYAPNVSSVLSADTAAIVSDRTKLVALRTPRSPGRGGRSAPVVATAGAPQISAERAQLKLDEAQLADDQVRLAASRIIAPAAGLVIAANGRTGEAVTPAGIRDYPVTVGRVPASQRPLFSLLPEGPQSQSRVAAGGSALPVVAVRTSSSWQVAALVPEESVSRLSPGRQVTIGVPAAQIGAVPGRIAEVLSDPVSTPQGTEYQALVTITGHVARLPLSGMAADVKLASPPSTGPRRSG